MLLKAYILMGCLACGWFAVAAANGWKAPSVSSGSRSSSSGGGGGYFFYSGGRSTSGSGGWGGGK